MQIIPNNAPQWRADIKGQVAEYKADCVAQIKNEIRNSCEFIMGAEDTRAWEDFAQYLTETEIRNCFKNATRS